MQITKITIGRLYNLGNYEHIRYELTVDVPLGESPATAIIGMEKILTALDPKRPEGVRTPAELRRAEVIISNIENDTEEQVAREYGKSKSVVLFERRKMLQEAKERAAKWDLHQIRVRKLLEDLGGAANFTDAKETWDDLDTEF